MHIIQKHRGKQQEKTHKVLPLEKDDATVGKGMILFCYILFPCMGRENTN